jgi:hypothetical protein
MLFKVPIYYAMLLANSQHQAMELYSPPNYNVVMEMDPHGSERSSRDGSHDALSDCTASTELEVGERGEGGVRHGSPESCESTCCTLTLTQSN